MFLEEIMANIAIVDDSRLARTFTAACLRKNGHEVEEIEPTSIFDVVKILQTHTPDLLIMDFLMPNCPGTSLARVCHEDANMRGMRTLVLTAHRDDDITARLKTMGVAEVMFKPFEPQTLLDAVESILKAPAAED
jgi:two-component system chemotaxis response regulator CheY